MENLSPTFDSRPSSFFDRGDDLACEELLHHYVINKGYSRAGGLHAEQVELVGCNPGNMICLCVRRLPLLAHSDLNSRQEEWWCECEGKQSRQIEGWWARLMYDGGDPEFRDQPDSWPSLLSRLARSASPDGERNVVIWLGLSARLIWHDGLVQRSQHPMIGIRKTHYHPSTRPGLHPALPAPPPPCSAPS